jgi:hypothetical protein
LRTFGSEFRIGAQDLRRVTAEVGQTFDAMLSVTASLDDRIAGLSSDEADVRESLGQLAAGLDRYYDVQRSSSADMVASSVGLTAAAERALDSGVTTAAALRGLEDAVFELRQQNQLAVDTHAEAARLTRETLEQSAGAMKELQLASTAIQGVLERLQDVAPSMLAAAERQSVSAGEMRGAVSDLVQISGSTALGVTEGLARLTAISSQLLVGVQLLSAQMGAPRPKRRKAKRWLWIFPARHSVPSPSAYGRNGRSMVHKDD